MRDNGSVLMDNFDYLLPFDKPGINNLIFYPRPDPGLPLPGNASDHFIEVDKNVHVVLRFFIRNKNTPTILVFSR